MDSKLLDRLREDLEKIAATRSSNPYEKVHSLMTYLGNRMLSDSAVYHALRCREQGGTTDEIIRAAFKGAFGQEPSSSQRHQGDLDKETQRFAADPDARSHMP